VHQAWLLTRLLLLRPACLPCLLGLPARLQLVDKSADLSMASQMFYKQARKANSCCRFM
jgi:hypothetical protein